MQVHSTTRERLPHDRHAEPQCAKVGHRLGSADLEGDMRDETCSKTGILELPPDFGTSREGDQRYAL